MESFDELWARLAGPVRAAVARHRSRDAALGADDLVQEVRIRVWKTFQRDNNSRFSVSYYMRVVNSAIIDTLRRSRGFYPADGESGANDPDLLDNPAPGPEDLIADEERGRRLIEAIDGLPAARGQALMLYLQGYNVAEIAKLLNCNQDRAHNLTYRGVRDLKKRMRNDDD